MAGASEAAFIVFPDSLGVRSRLSRTEEAIPIVLIQSLHGKDTGSFCWQHMREGKRSQPAKPDPASSMISS